MSTNQNGNTNRQQNGGRSVRFAPQVETHRSVNGGGPSQRRKKRRLLDRPNQDEQDDIDDWVDDEDHIGASTKELMNAKRSRRLKREHVGEGDDDDDDGLEETHVDASTSLAADADEEVPVEPFNMDAERTDGSGYFEGDTYVFRKRDVDEEPDAWLESMDDSKLPAKQKTLNDEESSDTEQVGLDELSREELYAKLIPLVSDTETILQALVRYGDLLKRKDKNKDAKASTATAMAQQALDTVTEASNALLLKGDVNIYQQTRKDLTRLMPSSPAKTKVPVQWEYRGNQDGQLHGPFTTDQMKSWTAAGYFIGEQAVQIRTVSTSASDKGDKDKKPSVNDLLSDLMDDDDEDDDDEKEERSEDVRGEWMSSNDVNFSAYL